jgi:hypothetical protein
MSPPDATDARVSTANADRRGLFISWQNVKEHATLSARAHVDHGVEVRARKGHVNRAADRGCVSRLVGLFDYVSVK